MGAKIMRSVLGWAIKAPNNFDAIIADRKSRSITPTAMTSHTMKNTCKPWWSACSAPTMPILSTANTKRAGAMWTSFWSVFRAFLYWLEHKRCMPKSETRNQNMFTFAAIWYLRICVWSYFAPVANRTFLILLLMLPKIKSSHPQILKSSKKNHHHTDPGLLWVTRLSTNAVLP